MAKKTVVEVTVKMPGIHFWADAKPPVEYLRDKHRHTFHFTARKQVLGLDREIEFIQLRRNIISHLEAEHFGDSESLDFDGMSCEMLAQELVEAFTLASCTVSEDGEFGATVYADTSHTLNCFEICD